MIGTPSARAGAAAPPAWPSLSSSSRYVAAALAAVAAATHVPVVEDHLETAPYLGAAFIGFIGVSLVLASMLVRHDSVPVWRGVAGLNAAAIATLAVSRTVGLPEVTDDVGRWSEPLAVVAVTTESLLCLVALWVLLRASAAAPSEAGGTARRLPAALGALTLLVGLSGTAGAASAEVSGSAVAGGRIGAVPASGARAATRSQMSAMPGMVGASMTGDDYWSQVDGSAVPPGGTTRSYFISSDEVLWNYAPTGKNQITGKAFDEVADTYVQRGKTRIGSTYLKCLYRAYTDATFTTLVARPAQDAYLGVYGPVIHAEVGDTIRISFRNTCRIPTTMHPHGVFYTKSSEGAPYADGTSGADKADDSVPKGGKHTFVWKVPFRAGPGPNDGSSVMWMYHSHSNEIRDTYAGLMGPMVVTAQGMAKPDGSPKDVDREVFELFSVMNENNSPYLPANVTKFTALKRPPGDGSPDADDFNESNLMHSINGYVFGNQPLLTLTRGQHVRWYVMDMGTEVDLHTPHWHGNDVVVNGMRMDVINLLPASMVVADMVPDNPGIWLFHCHVNDHLTAGMITRYKVA